MSNFYMSNYDERISRTPRDPSRWSGKRGESECLPTSEETRSILRSYGKQSVTYTNGIPDFSPFSEATVTIDGMSGGRASSRIKMVDQNNAFGRAEEYHYKHLTGNYAKADIAAAKEWNAIKKDGRNWTPSDVKAYREANARTWHECNDRKTMMLVPTKINSEFTHLGGTSESQTKSDIDNLITRTTLYKSEDNSNGNAFQRTSGEYEEGKTKVRVVSAERRR